MADVTGKVRGKQDVPANVLRSILEEYEYLRDEFQVKITLTWDKVFRASNAESLHRLIEVVPRFTGAGTTVTSTKAQECGPFSQMGSQDILYRKVRIYIRAEPKELKAPIKKDYILRLEKAIRTG